MSTHIRSPEGNGPSVTARRVAAHRLAFSRVQAPYGAPAADEALAADVAAGLAAPANRMDDYLAARTSFFDRTVVSAIDRGVRQVVVGAAGYDGRGMGPAGGQSVYKRYWRWAEPDGAYGVSGQPNNKFRPMNETTSYGTTGSTAGNNAGANDELFSFHPGGVNCLFGDGSVRFIKDSVGMVVLRGLVTSQGGEVLSADSY